MSAAVVVLSWNGENELGACLEALRDQDSGPADVLVVDNGSSDRSVALVRERFPAVQCIENGRNLGFARGMNVGMRALMERPTPPDAIVLLNQDTIVAPDWLRQILAPFAEAERIAAVGCKIYYPDGQTIQHAGAWIQLPRAFGQHIGWRERDTGQYDEPRDMETVTGAAIALRVSSLYEVGLLDEGYTHYYEDSDLCWRLRRAGYRVRYAPLATLRHAESQSLPDFVRRSTLLNRNRLRFIVKTMPSELLWTDFVLAERVYLALHAVGPEGRALRRAYMEGILHGQAWRAAREQFYHVTPSERARLETLCAGLRHDLIAFDRSARPWKAEALEAMRRG
jgi:GT2 family glycosyltransferase